MLRLYTFSLSLSIYRDSIVDGVRAIKGKRHLDFLQHGLETAWRMLKEIGLEGTQEVIKTVVAHNKRGSSNAVDAPQGGNPLQEVS